MQIFSPRNFIHLDVTKEDLGVPVPLLNRAVRSVCTTMELQSMRITHLTKVQGQSAPQDTVHRAYTDTEMQQVRKSGRVKRLPTYQLGKILPSSELFSTFL